MRSLLLGAALVCAAATAHAQVAATKKKEDPGTFGGKWYGTAELRHHVNTYVDDQAGVTRQEPSAHVRLQLGAQFYEGAVDAYATLGAFRVPRTQQIMQRRPEMAVDLYPVKTDYFSVLQYNMVQLPVKAEATSPTVEDEKTEGALDPGTIYTFGLAPSARYPFMAAGKVEVKGGLDGWTRLYSRRQYTSDYHWATETEDEDGDTGTHEPRFGLDEDGSAEPIEDYALHYQSQAWAGLGYTPDFARAMSTEVTAHHQSRFDPRYTRSEDGGTDYTYGATRYSYYQMRLRFEVNERVSLTNDFYHFHEGFFAEKREGDERRYRNIVRLSCRL